MHKSKNFPGPDTTRTRIQQILQETPTLPQYLLSQLSNKSQSHKSKVALVNADTKSSLSLIEIEKMIKFIGETHKITLNNLFLSDSNEIDEEPAIVKKMCAIFLPNHEQYFSISVGLMHAGIKVGLLNPFESIHSIRRAIEVSQIPIILTTQTLLPKLKVILNCKKWLADPSKTIVKKILILEDFLSNEIETARVPVQNVSSLTNYMITVDDPTPLTTNLQPQQEIVVDSQQTRPEVEQNEAESSSEKPISNNIDMEQIIISTPDLLPTAEASSGEDDMNFIQTDVVVEDQKNEAVPSIPSFPSIDEENSNEKLKTEVLSVQIPKLKISTLKIEKKQIMASTNAVGLPNNLKILKLHEILNKRVPETKELTKMPEITAESIAISIFHAGKKILFSHKNLISSIIQMQMLEEFSFAEDRTEKEDDANNETISILGLHFWTLFPFLEIFCRNIIQNGKKLVFFENLKREKQEFQQSIENSSTQNFFVTEKKFDETAFFMTLEYWNIASLFTNPTALFKLSSEKCYDLMQERKLGGSLRTIICTGNKLDIGVAHQFKRNFKKSFASQKDKKFHDIVVKNYYKTSEAAGPLVVQSTKKEVEDFPTAIGYPLPGIEFKIEKNADELRRINFNSFSDAYFTSVIVPDSSKKKKKPKIQDIGFLCFRGAEFGVSRFFLNEKKEQAPFNPEISHDGWMNTKDMGFVDKQSGQIYVLRQDEAFRNTIEFDGIRINQIELEALIKKHPAVDDVLILAKKSKLHGEIPNIFITLNKDFMKTGKNPKFSKQVSLNSANILSPSSPVFLTPVPSPRAQMSSKEESPVKNNGNFEKEKKRRTFKDDDDNCLVEEETNFDEDEKYTFEFWDSPDDENPQLSTYRDGNVSNTTTTTTNIPKSESRLSLLPTAASDVIQNTSPVKESLKKKKNSKKMNPKDVKKSIKDFILFNGIYLPDGEDEEECGYVIKIVKKFPSEFAERKNPAAFQKLKKKLLPSSLEAKGTGGFITTVVNLLNSAVGVGVLSLPYAFSRLGIVGGSFGIIFYAFFAGISQKVVADASLKIKQWTYAQVVKHYMGLFFYYLLQFFVIVLLYGFCASYLIIVGNSLTLFVESFIGTQYWWICNRYTSVLFVSIVALLPLSLLNSITILSWTSILTLVGSAYITLFIFWSFLLAFFVDRSTALNSYFPVFAGTGKPSKIDFIVGTGVNSIGFPLLFNAWAMVPSCYSTPSVIAPSIKELKKPTKALSNHIIWVHHVLLVIVYIFVGTIGYLLFGSDIKDDILMNFPTNNIGAMAGRLCAIVVAICCFPILHFIGRLGVRTLLFNGVRYSVPLHLLITLVPFFIIVGVSMLIPNVSIMLGFVGAIGSTSMMFIFSGVLFWRVYRVWWTKVLSVVMIVLGVFQVVLGTTSNVFRLLNL